MFKPLAFVALPLLMAAAAPAFAASDSVIVSYHDLNLAQPADVVRLHNRIAAAVVRVTGADDIRDGGVQRAVAHNRAVAMASAEAQMQVAVAAARSGQQLAMAGGQTITAGF